MTWYLIVKDRSKQPRSGEYTDWKQQIAEDCFFQCVYCAIHESQFGGTVNYHIDHFRPISKFGSLINDICNLFYCCPICNKFKSNDWPGEPDLDKLSYPDPCKVDYNTIFEIDPEYNLKGLYTASNYIIQRLFLNRAQLIYHRREAALRKKLGVLISQLEKEMIDLANEDLQLAYETLSQIDRIKNTLLGLEKVRERIRPYNVNEIQKRR